MISVVRTCENLGPSGPRELVRSMKAQRDDHYA